MVASIFLATLAATLFLVRYTVNTTTAQVFANAEAFREQSLQSVRTHAFKFLEDGDRYNQLLAALRNDDEYFFKNGQKAEAHQDIPLAISWYRKAVLVNPENTLSYVRYYWLMSAEAERNGQMTEAYDWIAKAFSMLPQDQKVVAKYQALKKATSSQQ